MSGGLLQGGRVGQGFLCLSRNPGLWELRALRRGRLGPAYEELSASSDALALELFLGMVPSILTPLWVGTYDRAPFIRRGT